MNSRRAGKLMIKLDINSNKLNVPCERCGYTTIIDISRIKKCSTKTTEEEKKGGE